jgi:hypothetical protein
LTGHDRRQDELIARFLRHEPFLNKVGDSRVEVVFRSGEHVHKFAKSGVVGSQSSGGGSRAAMTGKPQKEPDGLRPDGWERFERAVDAAVKSGPKHRTSKPIAKPAKKKGGS